ncbi:MAG: hypothetical protein ACI8WT_001726 [Clostridium sp.]|jgi:hypothetical protein
MTDKGKLILTIYSIIVVSAAVIGDVRRGDKGWKGTLLIPTLILLMNL